MVPNAIIEETARHGYPKYFNERKLNENLMIVCIKIFRTDVRRIFVAIKILFITGRIVFNNATKENQRTISAAKGISAATFVGYKVTIKGSAKQTDKKLQESQCIKQDQYIHKYFS